MSARWSSVGPDGGSPDKLLQTMRECAFFGTTNDRPTVIWSRSDVLRAYDIEVPDEYLNRQFELRGDGTMTMLEEE